MGQFVGRWVLEPPARADQGRSVGQAELGYRILRRYWRIWAGERGSARAPVRVRGSRDVTDLRGDDEGQYRVPRDDDCDRDEPCPDVSYGLGGADPRRRAGRGRVRDHTRPLVREAPIASTTSRLTNSLQSLHTFLGRRRPSVPQDPSGDRFGEGTATDTRLPARQLVGHSPSDTPDLDTQSVLQHIRIA